KIGAGGLSGKPVKNRSTEVIKFLREHLGSEPLIIGVGGIHSADDAWEKLNSGADLIQLYTGFIYEGPSLIRAIHQKCITNHDTYN
nr:dihydroorotate dehydrogenase (quinone) [Flavobacteriales bacterium]